MTRWILALACLLIPSAMAAANGPGGLWFTEKGKVAVALEPCGDAEGDDAALCGRIAWLKSPRHRDGALKRDTQNADPALRDRPWCGLTVITGLRQAGSGVWTGGTFYYPKDGNRYDVEIREGDEGLTVRAFLGVRFLGKTEDWRRVDKPLPDCPAG